MNCIYEKVCVTVREHAKCQGVVMALFHPGRQAELIAALNPEIDRELPQKLRTISDQVTALFNAAREADAGQQQLNL